MRIAIVAPPFIPVPPKLYGGTELFVSQLAEGLKAHDVDVVVYTNGESTVGVEKRWLFAKQQWPLEGEIYDNLKDINHTTWAIKDAMQDCDVIHLNNVAGLATSRLVERPFVYTMHHPHLPALSDYFEYFPDVHYVTISDFQRERERVPHIRTIHHGIDLASYQLRTKKDRYLSFIGRIAPVKGTHIAIEVAKRAGIPLKIAGEVQPIFQEYFEREVKPHVDGKFIEYVGRADLAAKNELLGNSLAMLFPIQWDEPFGLVMIEAMACGTPVLAFRGGSVPEVIAEGISGYICRSTDDMVDRLSDLRLPPERVRVYAEQHFSLDRMVDGYIELYRSLITGAESAPEELVSGGESAVA